MIIHEPDRGKSIMTTLNHFVSQSEFMFSISSILSDAIVFTFPLILILLTIIGWRRRKVILQEAALVIFSSSAIAALINILIQLIVTKDRPESLPGLQLILNHLPTMSFPSDHTAVAIAFSISFLLLLSKYSKQYNTIGIVLLIASIIMGICRTAVAVHRPTDILAGSIIGVISAYLLYSIKESVYIKQIIHYILGLENKILDAFLFRFK